MTHEGAEPSSQASADLTDPGLVQQSHGPAEGRVGRQPADENGGGPASSGARSPRTPRRVRHASWEGNPSWRFFLQVLAALGVTATVVGAAATVISVTGENDPSFDTSVSKEESRQPSDEGAAASDNADDPAPSSPVQIGDCLDERLDVLDCSAVHAYEIVALETCDDTAFIRYLGGDPAVDIVRAKGERLTLPTGRTVCVARGPMTGVESVGSVAGVLGTADGDAWRACADARTGLTDVPCSQPHTAEYVLLPSQSMSGVTCDDVAETYLGAPLDRFDGRLVVETDQRTDGIRCSVSTLGADLLGASIRGIGVSALPLVQE